MSFSHTLSKTLLILFSIFPFCPELGFYDAVPEGFTNVAEARFPVVKWFVLVVSYLLCDIILRMDGHEQDPSNYWTLFFNVC